MATKKRKAAPQVGHPLEKSITELEAGLQDVKRLLILLLAKFGADSNEIGMALGVDGSTIRRTISLRKVNKIVLGAPADE